MATMARVMLQAKKARPFFGRHPWVYASAIESVEGTPQTGEIVKVISFEKKFIAYGLYNGHSKLRVRLYSWDEEVAIEDRLFDERVRQSIARRRLHPELMAEQGGCRLVYSESDELCGLVVDRYADHLVVQWSSAALFEYRRPIVAALQDELKPTAILQRWDDQIAQLEGADADDTPLAGSVPAQPIVLIENGVEFLVDLAEGQKTGHFLDQRENHLLASKYAHQQHVLDLFAYTGGFGITVAKLGKAKKVTAVESSGPAISLGQKNADRNGVMIEWQHQDVSKFLEESARRKEQFGLIICDPPKYARTHGQIEPASKAYELLNRQAMGLLKPGGVLITCSCSGLVSSARFLDILTESAQRANRLAHMIDVRSHAPDHPISLFARETEYLKCVVLRVY